MKKICNITAVLSAVCLLFSALAFTAEADGEFEISNGVLISYNGSAQSVTIPEGVLKIGDGAFKDHTEITDVSLANGTYSIGNRAFEGCTSLARLENTGSVTEVGAYSINLTALLENAPDGAVMINKTAVAFKGDAAQLSLPEDTMAIAPYAFADNHSLTAADLPPKLFSIGEGAFYNCSALASVSVPAGAGDIGAFAFYGTAWLNNYPEDCVVEGDGVLIAYKGKEKTVVLPAGIKHISGGAFYQNQTIERVYVLKGCLSIGIRAFADCPALLEVCLPTGVKGISSLAFENSPSAGASVQNGSDTAALCKEQGISVLYEWTMGDVNDDGEVTAADATLVLQYYGGLLTDAQTFVYPAADVDRDGVPTSADATLILQIYGNLL